jgi:hypothetical protein
LTFRSYYIFKAIILFIFFDETYLTSYSIKTEDQPITEQKQTDEEKELFVEQEEILSACQSQQIMSQIHEAGITATCIPEEDE